MADDHLVAGGLLVALALRGRERRLVRCRLPLPLPRGGVRRRHWMNGMGRMRGMALRGVLGLPDRLALVGMAVALSGRALLRLTRRSTALGRRLAVVAAGGIGIAGERPTGQQRR